MSGLKIETSTTVGVDLTVASQLPLHIGATGTIAVAGPAATAVYDSLTSGGSIYNDGMVASSAGDGIDTAGSAVVVNGAALTARTAVISGGAVGIELRGGGSRVANFGTIAGGAGGIVAGGGAAIVNGSTLDSAASIAAGGVGVDIAGPGRVTNFGTLTSAGIDGVAFAGRGDVANYGTVAGPQNGIVLSAGGSVVNGSTADTTALIGSKASVALSASGKVTLTNFATIVSAATGEPAVALDGGGKVVNGSTADTIALISGAFTGIEALHHAVAVTNFGTVSSRQGIGLALAAGGTVVNGSTADRTALIGSAAGNAVDAGGLATVTNFGTIGDTSTAHAAIGLFAGGTIVNGNATDSAALISAAQRAVYALHDAAVVRNDGTISAPHATAIVLMAGGRVVNGSTGDTSALIVSGRGGAIYGGSSVAVTNFATIDSNASTAAALEFNAGGFVANGSPSDWAATIVSQYVDILGHNAAVRIVNYGTLSAPQGNSLYLAGGGSVTNGSAADRQAAIAGDYYGVRFAAHGTVTNFGTIGGHTAGVYFAPGATGTVVNAGLIAATGSLAGGTTGSPVGDAVAFGGAGGLVVVDPGGAFSGVVSSGGGGTIELAAGDLAAGTGSIGGIGGAGAQFVGFATLDVDAASAWTLNGADSLASLSDSGRLTVAQSLDVSASIVPAGGGTIALASGAALSVQSVLGQGPSFVFSGENVLTVAAPTAFGLNIGASNYAGPLLENFGASDTVDLRGIAPAASRVKLGLAYTAATGLLTVESATAGAPALASLQFQPASLGGGSFHLTQDGDIMVLTHS